MNVNNSSKKIAIISSQQLKISAEDTRIDCFTWNNLQEHDSIADYDRLILSLPAETMQTQVRGNVLLRILDVQRVIDLFIRGTLIFVVGDPRFECENDGKPFPFLFWTGMDFEWNDAEGDQIERNQNGEPNGFDTYAGHIKQWSYSLRSVEPYGDVKRALAAQICGSLGQFTPQFKCEHIYRTRHKDGLITFVLYMAEAPHPQVVLPAIPKRAPFLGGLCLLPKIDLCEEDTVRLVLSEICLVSTGVHEPEWARDLKVCGQKELDEIIEETNRTLEQTQQKLKALQEKRRQYRNPLKLLYSTSDDLEIVTRKALEELGAEIGDKDEDIGDDAFLSVEIGGKRRFATVEVKSTTKKSFKEQGLRQLSEWQTRRIERQQRKYKGIFIGNNLIALPPDVRTDPFSDGFRKSTEIHCYVALRSSDLYDLLMAMRRNTLDLEEMWRLIFETNGILDISSLMD